MDHTDCKGHVDSGTQPSLTKTKMPFLSRGRVGGRGPPAEGPLGIEKRQPQQGGVPAPYSPPLHAKSSYATTLPKSRCPHTSPPEALTKSQ